jgi:hypothetical protein
MQRYKKVVLRGRKIRQKHLLCKNKAKGEDKILRNLDKKVYF